jgi:molybdate transport system substrate-binding protein
MDDLVAAWKATHPGQVVRAVLAPQPSRPDQEAAPFDVFFSGDAAYPGAEKRGSRTSDRHASTRSARSSSGRQSLGARCRVTRDRVLTDASVRTVAIANPEHAPYGRAAVAAMTTAGVYDAVKPKLVFGENVSQAAQFVESGNADAGIVALSLAVAPTLKDLGRFVEVPSTPTLLGQGAVVLDSAIDPGEAHAFLDFVLGPDGRAILGRYGFLMPPS